MEDRLSLLNVVDLIISGKDKQIEDILAELSKRRNRTYRKERVA